MHARMDDVCCSHSGSLTGAWVEVQFPRYLYRSNIQVGSLEMGSFHTAPIRAPISPLDLMGVVWEPYGRLPTYKLPSCNGL